MAAQAAVLSFSGDTQQRRRLRLRRLSQEGGAQRKKNRTQQDRPSLQSSSSPVSFFFFHGNSARNGDVGLLRNLEIAAAVSGDVAKAAIVNGSSGPLEKERRRETNGPPSPARPDLLQSNPPALFSNLPS
ncbi:hypothetical protein MRB53_025435 [Persea americana]|uniref:Uncharacterized protein n=1 Tax=Persea americana TaxID=3435 RepID=A0ACC2LGE0_PERAE|nr:hypothetical protein MRB53_025435 [Persea americana]